MLGADGPNVNKKVQRLINEEVLKLRPSKGLLDIGSCNIHILHNAFLAGLSKLGENAAALVSDLYHFSDGWPARCEDFSTIQASRGLPKHSFLKHVSSCWLTLEPAADRLLEQWEAIHEYFFDFIPKKKLELSKKSAFLKFRRILQSTSIKAELMFVCSSARIFTRFTGTFQEEQPPIHKLHTELDSLVKTLMGRVCTADAIKKHGISKRTLDRENLLPLENIILSDKVSAELLNKKFSELDVARFRKEVQAHFIRATEHILEKSSLKNRDLVKRFRCLMPNERKSARSCDDILRIAQALPVEVTADELIDEWELLQFEKDINDGRDLRIDEYWNHFVTMKKTEGSDLKYPSVAAVVKAALAVSHGQGDGERSFSASRRTLTKNRAAMSERTLNAYMVVKSAMSSCYKNKRAMVPMTKELITYAQAASSKYKQYQEDVTKEQQKELQNQKEIEEFKTEEERKKKIAEEEKISIDAAQVALADLKKAYARKRKERDNVLDEANKRLKAAEGVKKEEAEEKSNIDALEKQLDLQKQKLISMFSKK